MEKHAPSFAAFCQDLTTLARQGQFAPRVGTSEAEIARIFQILLRRVKNSVAVLDYGDGTGWQLATEVIGRLAIGVAPEALCSLRALALDCDALVGSIADVQEAKQIHQEVRSGKRGGSFLVEENEAEENLFSLFGRFPDGMEHAERVSIPLLDGGSGRRWDVADDPLEQPLIECFRSLRHHPERVLLVIEQLPRFLGAEWDTSPLNGRDHLLSALLHQRVQLLTVCDVRAYRHWVGRDAALERCIQVVSMPGVPL